MSASAPLGKPSRNTGRVDAVCTKATQIGEEVRDVIIQAAATSFIHIEMLAASQVPHNILKTGIFRGPQTVWAAADAGIAALWVAEAASGEGDMWHLVGGSGYVV